MAKSTDVVDLTDLHKSMNWLLTYGDQIIQATA